VKEDMGALMRRSMRRSMRDEGTSLKAFFWSGSAMLPASSSNSRLTVSLTFSPAEAKPPGSAHVPCALEERRERDWGPSILGRAERE
jgi:hypothetical protein